MSTAAAQRLQNFKEANNRHGEIHWQLVQEATVMPELLEARIIASAILCAGLSIAEAILHTTVTEE